MYLAGGSLLRGSLNPELAYARHGQPSQEDCLHELHSALTKRSGVDWTHCLRPLRVAGTRNEVRVRHDGNPVPAAQPGSQIRGIPRMDVGHHRRIDLENRTAWDPAD